MKGAVGSKKVIYTVKVHFFLPSGKSLMIIAKEKGQGHFISNLYSI